MLHYTAGAGGYRYAMPSEHAEWNEDNDSDSDLEYLAEVAAADFHSERDGWEGVWPRTITLYDGKTGPELARFTVEREYEPTFSAERDRPAMSAGDAKGASDDQG